jgi:hypothetical protein
MTNWDKLDGVGKSAPLTENIQNKPRTRAKNLKSVPAAYFEKHANLKESGKTSLDFSSYILEALREKLERDNA